MKNNIQRHSDDGEPSGTAGMPVLDVIIKEELTDICIVVTRYFGGTLLGAGGLIRAYAKSAVLGINEAGIIVMRLCEKLELSCDYTLFGKVKSEIENDNILIEDIVYGANVIISINIEVCIKQQFIKRMIDVTNAKIDILLYENKYIAF